VTHSNPACGLQATKFTAGLPASSPALIAWLRRMADVIRTNTDEWAEPDTALGAINCTVTVDRENEVQSYSACWTGESADAEYRITFTVSPEAQMQLDETCAVVPDGVEALHCIIQICTLLNCVAQIRGPQAGGLSDATP